MILRGLKRVQLDDETFKLTPTPALANTLRYAVVVFSYAMFRTADNVLYRSSVSPSKLSN